MIYRSLYLLVAVGFFASLQPSSGIPVRIARRTDESDNCGHPFHSFLCNKAPRARGNVPQPTIIRAVSVPTKQPPPPELPLSGENSFLDPTFISPTTTRQAKTTSTTPKPPPVLAGDSSIGDPVFVRPNLPPPSPPPRPLEAQAAVTSEVRSPPKDTTDLCAHSFHSFLCQPGRKGGRRIITGKMPTSLKGDNSFLDPVRIKTTKPPPPPRQPEIPDASFQSPSFYKPDPVPTPRTTKAPIPTLRSTTTPRPTPRSTTTPRPTPRFTTTPRAKTTTPQQPEIPDASVDSPSFFKPDPPRTTQPPRTTARVLVAAPQQVVKVTAQPEHYKGENPCNHAFHSYLCQPGRSSRRRNYGQAPVQPSASNQQPIVARPTTTTQAPEVPESSLLLAVALPPPTTKRPPPPPTTRRTPPPPPITTRKPPPPPTTTTPPPIEAAPSSNNFAGILPPRPKVILEAAANAPSSRVEQYDKCKHAFHSFLCQPARPRKIQIQPAPSNVESSLLLPDYRRTTPPPPTRPPPPTTRIQDPPTRRPPPPTTRAPPTTPEPVQVPDFSFNDPQRLAPPPSPVLEPAPSSLQNELLPAQFVRAPSETAADKCSHSFHGFLCKKAPRARRPIRIN